MEGVVELDDAVHLSADLLGGIVVIPRQGSVEFIMGCSQIGDCRHRVSVFEPFADTQVAPEGIARSGDADDTVGILRAIVGKGGDIAFEVDFTGMVIDTGIEQQGLSQHEADSKETLQPVGLAHHQSQAEIVVGVVSECRKSRQSGEAVAHQAYDTLWQGGIIELAADSGIGKVALQRDEVDVIVIARCDDEVIETIGTEMLGAGDTGIADAEAALGIVQVAGRKVGMNVSRDNGVFQFVGEVQDCWGEVTDRAFDHHLVLSVWDFGDEVAQLSRQVELHVRVINADGA